jgi:hypothetical protein
VLVDSAVCGGFSFISLILYVAVSIIEGLQFSDEGGPATLALECEGEETYLICCMSGFTSIEWFQFDNSSQLWQNVDYGGKQGM